MQVSYIYLTTITQQLVRQARLSAKLLQLLTQTWRVRWLHVMRSSGRPEQQKRGAHCAVHSWAPLKEQLYSGRRRLRRDAKSLVSLPWLPYTSMGCA